MIKLLHFYYFFLLVKNILSFSIINNNNNNNNCRYAVYDDIINDNICSLIDREAINGGLGHTVYDRSISPRSCIESTCNNILNELGDTSRYIEYWW